MSQSYPPSVQGNRYRALNKKLIDTYGTGVRPGWVSAELAMNEIYADAADKRAAEPQPAPASIAL